MCASSSAAGWEFAPRVEGGYRYSDNYRLDVPDQEIDVSGAEADVRLTLRTVDPRTNIEITPRVRSTYFPDEGELDSNDYFLGAVFDDATPRRRIGFKGEISREDVVRSELPEPEFGGDLGDPEAVDGGRVIQRNRRDMIRLAPYFRYDLTQRMRTELGAHYVDASFDRQFSNVQQDFTDAGVSAGLGFQVSPRSSVVVRGLASQYETSFDTDAYGAEVEWATDLTESSRVYVRVGGQQTEPDGGDSETSILAGVGGRWDSARNAVFLDLTRSVQPISAGTIVERHQLRARVDHDVSPRIALLFGARISRDEDLSTPATYPTREYASAEGGVEWRWQRYLSFTATYNYFFQEYEDEPSDRSSNGFMVSFVYEPKRRD